MKSMSDPMQRGMFTSGITNLDNFSRGGASIRDPSGAFG
jgi:hypothetical protein